MNRLDKIDEEIFSSLIERKDILDKTSSYQLSTFVGNSPEQTLESIIKLIKFDYLETTNNPTEVHDEFTLEITTTGYNNIPNNFYNQDFEE